MTNPEATQKFAAGKDLSAETRDLLRKYVAEQCAGGKNEME